MGRILDTNEFPFLAEDCPLAGLIVGLLWRKTEAKETHRGDGGLMGRVTNLRVLLIVVEYCPICRDIVHEIQSSWQGR
jgi:hypothetical protein